MPSRLLLLLLLMISSGIAQDRSNATVTFYRYREFYAASKKPSAFCDGSQIARIANGRFVELQLPPGMHLFTSNFPENGIELELKPGEHYYIRMALASPAAFHGARGQLFLVPKEQAVYEIGRLKKLDEHDFKWGRDDAEIQKENLPHAAGQQAK